MCFLTADANTTIHRRTTSTTLSALSPCVPARPFIRAARRAKTPRRPLGIVECFAPEVGDFLPFLHWRIVISVKRTFVLAFLVAFSLTTQAAAGVHQRAASATSGRQGPGAAQGHSRAGELPARLQAHRLFLVNADVGWVAGEHSTIIKTNRSISSVTLTCLAER